MLTFQNLIVSMLTVVDVLQQKLSQGVGSAFIGLLDETVVNEAMTAAEVTYRQRVYTPMVTLWAFLCQVLDPDKSLANAVKQLHC